MYFINRSVVSGLRFVFFLSGLFFVAWCPYYFWGMFKSDQSWSSCYVYPPHTLSDAKRNNNIPFGSAFYLLGGAGRANDGAQHWPIAEHDRRSRGVVYHQAWSGPQVTPGVYMLRGRVSTNVAIGVCHSGLAGSIWSGVTVRSDTKTSEPPGNYKKTRLKWVRFTKPPPRFAPFVPQCSLSIFAF